MVTRVILWVMAISYASLLVAAVVVFSCSEPPGDDGLSAGFIRLAPEAGLYGSTVAAVARVHDATGLVIPVDSGSLAAGSVRVRFGEPVADKACAETWIVYWPKERRVKSVDIVVRDSRYARSGLICQGNETRVLHELGHALRIEAHYADPTADDHAADGVYASGEYVYDGAPMTDSTLVKLCEFQPCSEFNPEAP